MPDPKPLKAIPIKAFTLKASGGGQLNKIITEIVVSEAFDPDAPPSPLPKAIQTKALWDTGASRSVIAKELAADLGLVPSGMTKVHHGAGLGSSPTYVVNFGLPHGVGVAGVVVTEWPPSHKDFQVLVGMDVIGIGDFSITNVSGHTWVSFRTPSCVAVDYVAEADKASKAAFAGVGRNDPCPCGSGKKFKKCHGA